MLAGDFFSFLFFFFKKNRREKSVAKAPLCSISGNHYINEQLKSVLSNFSRRKLKKFSSALMNIIMLQSNSSKGKFLWLWGSKLFLFDPLGFTTKESYLLARMVSTSSQPESGVIYKSK